MYARCNKCNATLMLADSEYGKNIPCPECRQYLRCILPLSVLLQRLDQSLATLEGFAAGLPDRQSHAMAVMLRSIRTDIGRYREDEAYEATLPTVKDEAAKLKSRARRKAEVDRA